MVVAMGEREAERCQRLVGETSDVVAVETQPQGLPLARARNAGARRALDAGAELLVFLDVDCIPGAALLERYAAAAGSTPALLCGPVAYLPPAPPDGYPAARPALTRHAASGASRSAGGRGPARRRSCAVLDAVLRRHRDDVAAGRRVLRGLPRLRRRGHRLRPARQARRHRPLVGGRSLGLPPAPRRPRPRPIRHLADILRNAALFHRRWGWWPMSGWLAAFAERGLARHDPATDRWVIVPVADRPSPAPSSAP